MHLDDPCGIGRTLALIEGRWKGAILWWLAERPRRFGELKRLLEGVTARVLTNHLRQLERDGLVARAVEEGPVTQVEYSLTPLGGELQPLLAAVSRWGTAHAAAVAAARDAYDARAGRP